MAHYDYIEKAVKVTRGEFFGILGIGAAVLWTGAYAATDLIQDRNKYIKMRTAGIYKDDVKQNVRRSHQNVALSNMYKDFGGKPLSPLAEELFHTHYIDRTKLV